VPTVREIFNKTFGGLTRAYYLRQLFFGSLFMVLIVFMATRSKTASLPVAMIIFSVVNTLLYPYARFAYEGVVGFIVGNNVFFMNALVMLFAKYMTMGLCWCLAVFIAPLGLGYLYFHHSKQERMAA
jgi:predicted membrane protein